MSTDPRAGEPRLIDRHPLPWINQPDAGEHHVTDANGATVYSGPDSAELSRLYCAAQEESGQC